MRNRLSLNSFFNRDRKVLYIVLSVVMISVSSICSPFNYFEY